MAEDADVDELVEDVARGKVLTDFCGAKIRRADRAIKTIVGELQVGEPVAREATVAAPADQHGRAG